MRDRRLRYVVLPRQGLLSEAIAASVAAPAAQRIETFGVDAPGLELLASASAARGLLLKSHLLRQSAEDGASAAAMATAPGTAMAELASHIEETDFDLMSQKFADGPALIKLTETARLAFEAVNPELRIVPISTYGLPKIKPRRKGKGAAAPAAATAGRVTKPARNAAGVVWSSDYKLQVLSGLGGGGDGAGVIVAVLDTGVDFSHPALTGSDAVSRCLILDEASTSGGPVDWGAAFAERAAHGTHVAGIIAARAGHGGPEGVAPAARIASYRIYPNNPAGEKGADNIDIINSIIAAVRDGCHVINLSFEGARLREDGVRSAILEAWNQGVVCIAAAGNGAGAPVSYPARHHNCVAVTALGKTGAYPPDADFHRYESTERSQLDPLVYLAAFSNFGPQVQFAAPGHAIVSTFPNGEWWFDSGTSMAAPFVTGILARLLSSQPAIRDGFGDASRSAAMLQILIAQAKALRLPQRAQEGYGLPA